MALQMLLAVEGPSTCGAMAALQLTVEDVHMLFQKVLPGKRGSTQVASVSSLGMHLDNMANHDLSILGVKATQLTTSTANGDNA